MVRRSLQASFMPGAYVFPGGAVDEADGSADHQAASDEPAERLARRIGAVTGVGDRALAYAVAALRECFEECGLWLGAPDHHAPAAGWAPLRARLHAGETLAALAAVAGLPLATSGLQPWSHWVTPVGLPKRFDTLFFVAPAPAGQVPEVDAGETTTLAWVHPPAALAALARGDFPMEFATVSTVESLRPFNSAAALLDHAAAQTSLPPLHPRLKLDANGHMAGVLLPGQAGYDQAHGA
jgi:8-oxo-dGTP pyrophosphatase MutT (NUDIX family)